MAVCIRRHIRRILCALVLLVVVPTLAAAQALPGLSSLRVTYNTRKATVKPQGALKAQVDALETELAEATKTGNTVRRCESRSA